MTRPVIEDEDIVSALRQGYGVEDVRAKWRVDYHRIARAIAGAPDLAPWLKVGLAYARAEKTGVETRAVEEWRGRTPDTAVPARVRARVFARYDGVCQVTGRKIGPADLWDLDHEIALINGGEHRENNLRPVLRHGAAHRLKTATDMKTKAKIARVQGRHLSLSKSRALLPGGKASKWKKKISGEVVER